MCLCFAHAMIFGVAREDVARVDGHGAIEKDRKVGYALRLLQLMQMDQKFLCSTYCERRNDGAASARGGTPDDGGKRILRARVAVLAVAIRGLDHKVVGCFDGYRRIQRDVIGAAEVAGEQDLSRRKAELDHCGTQNVSGVAESCFTTSGDGNFRVEIHGPETAQCGFAVLLGIERTGRLMLGKAVTVGEFGVLFLQMAAVPQKDFAQVPRRRRADHWTTKTVLDQQRQI